MIESARLDGLFFRDKKIVSDSQLEVEILTLELHSFSSIT